MRLFINNRPVDLSDDSPVLINKSIADVRTPDERNFDFTKTIVVPATANNKQLFTHIYELNLEIQNTTDVNFSPDFNPNLKAEARIESGIYIWRGYARLLKINIDDAITFELSIVGLSGNFFKEIGNELLSTLDLTRYNHTWNYTNISNSWNTSIIDTSATGGTLPFQLGRGYLYPMEDNNFTNPNSVNVTDFKPAVYAKTIVDQIFEDAGYSYSADSFFNETFFKKLIHPYPLSEMRLSDATITARLFRARRSSAQTGLDVGDDIVFNDDSSTGYYDNGSRFTTATGRWASASRGRYVFKATVTGTFDALPGSPYVYWQIWFAVYNNTSNQVIGLFGGTGTLTSGDTFSYSIVTNSTQIEFNDNISVRLHSCRASDGPHLHNVTSDLDIDINTNSTFENQIVEATLVEGDLIDMRTTMPEITKRQYLMDLFKMFNLYVDTDEDEYNTLIIKSRDDYYDGSVIDLSGKVDTVLEIIPMGELDANPYHFTYSEGQDVLNTRYKDETGILYGRARYFVNNDFIKDEKVLQVGFIPTVSNNNPASNSRVLPNIASVAGGKGSNNKMRVLVYGGYLTCSSWIFNYVGGSVTKTSYPYCGMTDHPVTPSQTIFFGNPKKLYYNLPQSTFTDNNLFNKYYRKYITEITDKDSKLVVMMLNISPADMALWSFRKVYYYDNSYYYLNKVIDYNPEYTGQLTKCEFLKLKSAPVFSSTSATWDGGSGTVGVDDLPPSDFVRLPIDDKKKDRDKIVIIDSDLGVDVVNSDEIYVAKDADKISIINSSLITVASGVTNVVVIGSQSLDITESNTIWIGGVKHSQSFEPVYAEIDDNFTVSNEDVIMMIGASANVDVYLPQLSDYPNKRLVIKTADSTYDLTINSYNADEILNGVTSQSTYTIAANTGLSVEFYNTGSQWIVINKT